MALRSNHSLRTSAVVRTAAPAAPVTGPLALLTPAAPAPFHLPVYKNSASGRGAPDPGCRQAPPSTRAEPTRNPAPGQGRSAVGCSTLTGGPEPASTVVRADGDGTPRGRPNATTAHQQAMIERAIHGPFTRAARAIYPCRKGSSTGTGTKKGRRPGNPRGLPRSITDFQTECPPQQSQSDALKNLAIVDQRFQPASTRGSSDRFQEPAASKVFVDKIGDVEPGELPLQAYRREIREG